MVKKPKSEIFRTYNPNLNNISTVVLRENSPFENGFYLGQHTRREIQKQYRRLFVFPGGLVLKRDELKKACNEIKNFIPPEYKEEMEGLASGAEVPLEQVYWINAVIPSVSECREWRKKAIRFSEVLSCSALSAMNSATSNGDLHTGRILDWIRALGVHKNPLVVIYNTPYTKNTVVNHTFAGFLGVISGHNDAGIVYLEQGWRDSIHETIRGKPFQLLAREMLEKFSDLESAMNHLENSPNCGTCDLVHMVGDGKRGKKEKPDAKVVLVDSRGTQHTQKPGETLEADYDYGRAVFKGIPGIVYSGMKPEVMSKGLLEHHGNINIEVLQQLAKRFSLSEAIQVVTTHVPQDPKKSIESFVSHANGLGIIPKFLGGTDPEKTKASQTPYHPVVLSEFI